MFAQVHYPTSLSPDELDDYLSMGWFRMGQSIFTTNFLNFKNTFYSAIWLRAVLPDFKPDKAQLKLKKLNEGFKVEIKNAFITAEKEVLFAKYKKSVSFEASASLEQLLYGKSKENVYATREINIFDGQKLIAIGFFDEGQESAAGISSFYDPDYRKFSLGKYLILLKMEFCKSRGMQYFYPGYFVPGYSSFDYKLQLAKNALQYFELGLGQWLAIDTFSSQRIPIDVMHSKLTSLSQQLHHSGLLNKVYKYEFFDANLIPDLNGLELFDYPLFLFCFVNENDVINPMVVYDVVSHQYHVLKCRSMWPSKLPNDFDDLFCAHLLKTEEILFSSASANEIASLVGSIKIKVK